MSYVKQNIKKCLARAEEIIRAGVWYDVSVGGDGEPGCVWEGLVTLQNNGAKDTADERGLELKFTRGSSCLTLFHKDPQDWKPTIITQMFDNTAYSHVKSKPTFVGERRFNVTVSRAPNARKIFKATQEKDSLVLVSYDGSAPTRIVWDACDIRDSTAKLNNVLLGYGIVRERPDGTTGMKLTGVRHLSNFIGGHAFVQLVVEGVVALEMESSEGHDHGPKFRLKLNDLHRLWGSNVELGNCCPELCTDPSPDVLVIDPVTAARRARSKKRAKTTPKVKAAPKASPTPNVEPSGPTWCGTPAAEPQPKAEKVSVYDVLSFLNEAT
jgi:hypothetical protein